MITNDASEKIKENAEKGAAADAESNIRKAFKNIEIKDGKWDWTKFKPIYTSNHQEM